MSLILKHYPEYDAVTNQLGGDFTIIEISELTPIEFKNDPQPHICISHLILGVDKLPRINEQIIEVTGKLFVMNSEGKTITTFTPTSQPGIPVLSETVLNNFAHAAVSSDGEYIYIHHTLAAPPSYRTKKLDILTGTQNNWSEYSKLELDADGFYPRNTVMKVGSLLDPCDKIPLDVYIKNNGNVCVKLVGFITTL